MYNSSYHSSNNFARTFCFFSGTGKGAGKLAGKLLTMKKPLVLWILVLICKIWAIPDSVATCSNVLFPQQQLQISFFAENAAHQQIALGSLQIQYSENFKIVGNFSLALQVLSQNRSNVSEVATPEINVPNFIQ
jgi:hypothetical protein